MKIKDTYSYKGFIIKFSNQGNQIHWKTEDPATLKKYGASVTLTEPISPEKHFTVAILLLQQAQRTIDSIRVVA